MSDSEENHSSDWFGKSKKSSTDPNSNSVNTSESLENGAKKLSLAPKPFDDYYNMNNEKRGLAIIFNHKEYQDNFCATRFGTEKDRDALEEIFKNLGFEVKVYNDLPVRKIKDALDKASRMDHSKSDCLVVAVMTHGNEEKLYAFDNPYPTSTLWSLFTGDLCPDLAAKPKLFFIQACRGKMVDDGAIVKFKVQTDSEEERFYSIPKMADILVMYSTVSGYYAWRDPNKGSPFMQSLAKQLKKNHKERDLLTMLTFVNRQVAVEFASIEPNAAKYHNKKEMCSIVSMLTRLLVFE